MTINSTKPYLVRSIYDWCLDGGFTPYVSVQAFPELDIPKEYIKNNEIIFNISVSAVQELVINNDIMSFAARFNGVARKLEIPIIAINSIFAKEVNQGISFSGEKEDNHITMSTIENSNLNRSSKIYQEKKIRKPKLRIIK
ncbi:ClpXP protease specificity-enhancing factor [Nitrosomonas supralitoralis]|uniref:ClpXP protease specificity-enhancing factor n=1 Tax=Nitrosomonas supralitoralis TaxID=2116706 RepID=A0A2P7NZA4_9PROT|nr:ClpXP protease specificity-enhancing factor [Nitrosomonas supralitoralis]PSJ18799.1 ClpXP protease specificity-enhancing factor [Nitrosomonas supralitoralis]